MRARTTRFNGAATHLQRNPKPIQRAAASDGMCPQQPPSFPYRSTPDRRLATEPELPLHRRLPSEVQLPGRRGCLLDSTVTQKGIHTSILTGSCLELVRLEFSVAPPRELEKSYQTPRGIDDSVHRARLTHRKNELSSISHTTGLGPRLCYRIV